MKICFGHFILALCALVTNFDPSESDILSAACPSVCTEKVSSNSTDQCTAQYYSVCPSDIPWNNTIQGEESRDLNLWPITLQNLEVSETQNSSDFSLELTWMLTQNSLANNVVIRSSLPVSQQCTQYQISQDTETKSNKYCHPLIQGNNQLSLEFLLAPKNISFSYHINIPDDLKSITDPSELRAWRPVVSIAADPWGQSLRVTFQLAPATLAAQKYVLQVFSVIPNVSVDTEELAANKDSVVFSRNLTANLAYYVAIRAVGCGATQCPVSFSSAVTLPAPPSDGDSTPLPPTTTTRSVSVDASTITGATDPSVIVNRTDQNADYDKKKNIIIGTVVGGIGLLVLVFVACYCFHRKRLHRDGSRPWPFLMQMFGRQTSNVETSLAEEKESPKVLLLYSYDCTVHEDVIKKFASYLKNPGHCEVFLDLSDVDAVKDMGIHSWIQEKIELAQFVVIVCSTGARFKCAKNRQFRMKQDREEKITESFVWSVDYVAEKIRTSRQAGEDIDKFIVVYFDYAGEHDVPPKLDVAIRYPLMNDILNLYCHLHGVKWETMVGTVPDSLLDTGDQMELVDRENNNKVEAGQVLSYNGLTEDTFTQTNTGSELFEAVNEAKNFFKDNPDWLGETLEAVGGDTSPVASQKNTGNESGKSDSIKGKSDVTSSTDGSESPENRSYSPKSNPDKNSDITEDFFYKERQKRRLKDEELQLNLLQIVDEKKEAAETSTEKGDGKVIPPLPSPSGKNSLPLDLVDLSEQDFKSSNQIQDSSGNVPVDKSQRRRPSKTPSNQNDDDSLRTEFQLNSPDFNQRRHSSAKRRNSKGQNNGSLQKLNHHYVSEDSALPNGIDEEIQLRKDIDSIQNFDVYHAHMHNNTPTLPPLVSLQTNSLDRAQLPKRHSSDLDRIVLDLDLSEYTPPEDFITMASRHENKSDNASNGLVNGIAHSANEANGLFQDGNEGFVNPIFDTNGNEQSVKSLNHFVVDFVDPSVKVKPEIPVNQRNSSST